MFCFVEDNVEYSHCIVFVFWKLFDGEVAECVIEIDSVTNQLYPILFLVGDQTCTILLLTHDKPKSE